MSVNSFCTDGKKNWLLPSRNWRDFVHTSVASYHVKMTLSVCR